MQGTATHSATTPSVLLLDQVLVKHLLVPDIIIQLVFKLKFDTVDLHVIAIFIEAESINLIVNHLHDLVLIKAI